MAGRDRREDRRDRDLIAAPSDDPRGGGACNVMNKVALIITAAMVVSSAAVAAGIDSRAYTCADLQSVIAAKGFVFIGGATFGDFVVASQYYCGGGEYVEPRSVMTADRADCPVNYCAGNSSGGGN
jgi:hypothetical protein